jgi:hypothetical protein
MTAARIHNSIWEWWNLELQLVLQNHWLDISTTIWAHVTHKTESPWPLHFKHSHWWKKAEPVQVRFTLRLRDQRSVWMQDGCKVYVDSYPASNGSCFMVTWTIFKNHILEVGLTKNRETKAPWMLTTVDLFYFNMLRTRMDKHSLKWHLVEGPNPYMASNRSCYMVTWTIFKNHLLEVGLTQNRETMALGTLTTIGLFYFIMCDDLHE